MIRLLIPVSHIKMASVKIVIRCPGCVGIFGSHKLADAFHFGIDFIDMIQQNGLDGFGNFRRAKFPKAMMADYQMFQKHGRFFRKIGNLLQFFFNDLDADDNVADESAFAGIIDMRNVFKLADLPYIMKNGTGHEQIPVNAGVMSSQFIHQDRHGQRMFQQAAQISVVHFFRGRCRWG